MNVHQLSIGPLASNCYIIENGKDAIIIDAPENAEPVLNIIREKELKVHALLCTHLHFDHISGVAHFMQVLQLPAYAGQGDIDMKETFFGRAMSFGMPPVTPFDALPLVEGEMEFGTLKFQAIATPGHSPGGFCFYFPESAVLISGDTLFRRSVGRADLPGGNPNTLIQSIKEKLFILPADTTVYPGHDRPTTIGEESTSNPYI